MHIFGKREMHIAITLGRHFWWHKNTLWETELPLKTTVFLSGRDEISPVTQKNETNFNIIMNHDDPNFAKGDGHLSLSTTPQQASRREHY
jgi:hypothetical protein